MATGNFGNQRRERRYRNKWKYRREGGRRGTGYTKSVHTCAFHLLKVKGHRSSYNTGQASPLGYQLQLNSFLWRWLAIVWSIQVAFVSLSGKEGKGEGSVGAGCISDKSQAFQNAYFRPDEWNFELYLSERGNGLSINAGSNADNLMSGLISISMLSIYLDWHLHIGLPPADNRHQLRNAAPTFDRLRPIVSILPLNQHLSCGLDKWQN